MPRKPMPPETETSATRKSRLAAAIIERAPLAMIEVHGPTHIVSHVNAPFCELVGKSKKDVLDKRFCEVVPGGDECTLLLDQVYQSGQAATLARAAAEDESATWLYAMWPALDDADRPAGVVIQMSKAAMDRRNLTDVNEALLLAGLRLHQQTEVAEELNAQLRAEAAERRRVEETLRESRAAIAVSEERLRFMAESMPQKIFTTTPSGGVEYLNQKWADFTGVDGWDWSKLVHPDDLAVTTSSWEQALAAGEALEVEQRLRRAAGTYRWHLTRALPRRGIDGQVVQWVGSSTDIHEQKLALEQLAMADRNKDDFLAMLAHELRNPLAPIKNAAHLLQTVKSDNATLLKARTIIERQADHLSKLVDELLDVSRIQRGKVRILKEPMALVKAVQRSVDSCESLTTAYDHTVTVELPSDPIYVDADPTRIDQILVNLITNAAKYTPSQGHIHVALAKDGGMAVVRVKDDGVGISPNMLQSVFEMFTQVEQSLERSRGGLGLGLLLVHDLVELHGGTVEAKSEGLGKGSEFIVRLPLRPAAPDLASRADAPPSSSPSRARRILVVDDSLDNRETLELLLEDSGHSVELAEDGEQAVQKALRGDAELAFVDIGLPKLNGYDVARAIRSSAGGDKLVLIALSGYGQPEDKRKALDAGFDAHLTKPVDPDALLHLVDDIEKFRQPKAAATNDVSFAH